MMSPEYITRSTPSLKPLPGPPSHSPPPLSADDLLALPEQCAKPIKEFLLYKIVPESADVQTELFCFLLKAQHGVEISANVDPVNELKILIGKISQVDLSYQMLNDACALRLDQALGGNTTLNIDLSNNYLITNWVELENIRNNPNAIFSVSVAVTPTPGSSTSHELPRLGHPNNSLDIENIKKPQAALPAAPTLVLPLPRHTAAPRVGNNFLVTNHLAAGNNVPLPTVTPHTIGLPLRPHAMKWSEAFNQGLSSTLLKNIMSYFFYDLIPQAESEQAELVCWFLSVSGDIFSPDIKVVDELTTITNRISELNLSQRNLENRHVERLLSALDGRTKPIKINLKRNPFTNKSDIKDAAEENSNLIFSMSAVKKRTLHPKRQPFMKGWKGTFTVKLDNNAKAKFRTLISNIAQFGEFPQDDVGKSAAVYWFLTHTTETGHLPKGTDSASYIEWALQNGKNISLPNMSNAQKKIGNENIKLLIEGLIGNTSLESIDLRWQPISDESIEKLKAQIAKNQYKHPVKLILDFTNAKDDELNTYNPLTKMWEKEYPKPTPALAHPVKRKADSPPEDTPEAKKARVNKEGGVKPGSSNSEDTVHGLNM